MSVIEHPRDPADDAHEQRLFELLDAYVESLRDPDVSAEDLDPPEELLDAFPNLPDMLDCLDSLESFCERPAVPDKAQTADAPTLLSSESSLTSTESAFAAAPLRDFGPYELLDEIGRGGMGVVYRARHKALGAVVAVKLIRSSQLASQQEVQRFYQEARAAAGLSHSHIIKVHDVGEYSGQHFLSMDLVDGPNLADLLKDGAVDPERAAQLMADIARAVHYLHTRGIVHRDLKPSNILLDEDGEPYVTDFGLAKDLAADSQQTATGTIIGTPSYMAPEQAGGRRGDVGACSDVYSLGAILYELLTGRPVFREENPLDTLMCVLEREPVLPHQLNPHIPETLEQICLRCLEKQPERRYATALEVANDLEQFLKGEPITVPTRSPWRRFTKWLAREPALVTRLAALLIVLPIIQLNYWLNEVTALEHWPVVCVLLAWAICSWGLQRLLRYEARENWVRFVWAGVDAVLFGLLIYLAGGPVETLYAGFPLLIAASGLWFRVRVVCFMTLACAVEYWVLAFAVPNSEVLFHYRGIFTVILLATGSVVAFQVYRIRRLSRYFELRGPQASGSR